METTVTNKNIIEELFEKEIPEISHGIVEIKSIAREPRKRTKIAVYSHNPSVDAIGSCIGTDCQRIKAIINELHGEKIDIIEWCEDVSDLVKKSLAPAEIVDVVEKEDNRLIVIVDDSQLSLAIGKKGINARLASELIGRKIEIKTLKDLGNEYFHILKVIEASHTNVHSS